MTFVECAKKSVIDACKQEMPSDLKASASTVVELHLATESLPMPIQVQEEKIHELLRQGCDDLATLRTCIEFEKTDTIKGICRVMVRTHLNRSGVAYISRGEEVRTLARRVLGLFDGIADMQSLVGWEPLLDHWLAFAESSWRNGDLLFSDRDISSLRLLLGGGEGCRPPEAHNNWIRVVNGVYSGFNYLNSEPLNLQAKNIWDRINDATGSFERIDALLTEARQNVIEYGPALAGSFFADLGHPDFVKPDVHVRGCVAAYLGRDNVPAREAFEFVFNAAVEAGMSPRALDKLLYIGGSGRFYLVGIRASRPKEQKQAFLTRLRDCGRG